MTPSEFEYLIRQTIVYLEFHDDDSAKRLISQWRQMLDRVRQLEQNNTKGDR
ncbi:hypothetical protein [Baaleninema simplex]|uniref:hypothetical protein n=1 Tax=Baaleninema simplex TaxID=2862350 RepID=UPI00034B5E71|nr:hypothetical protein [Baaleninema simplex]